jgi:UDP-glucuronate decarboxylase
LTIYGDGKQTRSFCYVDDLIEGLVNLFFKENVNGPVNLGNPIPATMMELADEIRLLCNSKSKIIHLPLPSDDPTNREPDIKKAQNLLGWNPKISREVGLERTISYFKSVI